MISHLLIKQINLLIKHIVKENKYVIDCAAKAMQISRSSRTDGMSIIFTLGLQKKAFDPMQQSPQTKFLYAFIGGHF
jgi:hypothetical protein